MLAIDEETSTISKENIITLQWLSISLLTKVSERSMLDTNCSRWPWSQLRSYTPLKIMKQSLPSSLLVLELSPHHGHESLVTQDSLRSLSLLHRPAKVVPHQRIFDRSVHLDKRIAHSQSFDKQAKPAPAAPAPKQKWGQHRHVGEYPWVTSTAGDRFAGSTDPRQPIQ